MSGGLFSAISRILGSRSSKVARDLYDDLSPQLAAADATRVAVGLQACLLGRGGRANSAGRCIALGRAYMALGLDGRWRFLEIVARDFAADGASTLASVADLDEFNDWRAPFARHKLAAESLELPRWRLLRMLGETPDGDSLLELMRSDLEQLTGVNAVLDELATELDEIISAL